MVKDQLGGGCVCVCCMKGLSEHPYKRLCDISSQSLSCGMLMTANLTLRYSVASRYWPTPFRSLISI